MVQVKPTFQEFLSKTNKSLLHSFEIFPALKKIKVNKINYSRNRLFLPDQINWNHKKDKKKQLRFYYFLQMFDRL